MFVLCPTEERVKTTLAEAMLFNTGVLDRFGKVLDGTTTTDYDPEEIKRKISISTAIAPCEWKDCKINVIDTPGYFDFVGEVKQGIRVADGCNNFGFRKERSNRWN